MENVEQNEKERLFSELENGLDRASDRHGRMMVALSALDAQLEAIVVEHEEIMRLLTRLRSIGSDF